MATTSSARECPICLDKFRDPVVTPCGHLACDPCIKTYARRSSDHPYEATCPTCRAPFPTVTPNMSIVPKKYHIFISSPLRRVFLGDVDDSSHELIEKLNAENAALKARVGALRRDKDLLMDRCEAGQSALARLRSDERAARLALNEAREGARVAKRNLEKLQIEHEALVIESRDLGSRLAAKGKRTSRHAALDDSMRASSDDSPEFSRVSINGARPMKPMPKRPKLRPIRAVSPERTVRPSPPSPIGSISRRLLSSESSSESSPEPARRTSAQSGRRLCDFGMRGNVRIVRDLDSDSGEEAENHDERSNMENGPAARLPSFSSLISQDAPLPPAVFLRNPRRSMRLGRPPMN